MVDPAEHGDLARLFAELVDTSLPRAPLNAALCRVVADDPELISLLADATPSQRQPVLLLAALHLLVLEEDERSNAMPARDELAAWYPTVTEWPRDPLDAALAPALRRFVDGRAESIRAIVGARHVQTNEIGRCALFLPSMAAAHRESGRPLAHLDVGTSAGLTLLLPHLAVDYDVDERGDGRSTHHPVGDGDIRLTCGVRGTVADGLPTAIPPIGESRGLDPRPVDVTDPDAARWLLACCWPDEQDRFDRLRSALDLRRSRRADIDVGTSAAVADSIDRLDPAHHPVVTTSWVLNYADGDERTEFVAQLDRLGADRDLDWVFAESPGRTPELPHPPSLVGGDVTALVRVAWRDGERSVRHLARAHPHGHWMQGLGA